MNKLPKSRVPNKKTLAAMAESNRQLGIATADQLVSNAEKRASQRLAAGRAHFRDLDALARSHATRIRAIPGLVEREREIAAIGAQEGIDMRELVTNRLAQLVKLDTPIDINPEHAGTHLSLGAVSHEEREALKASWFPPKQAEFSYVRAAVDTASDLDDIRAAQKSAKCSASTSAMADAAQKKPVDGGARLESCVGQECKPLTPEMILENATLDYLQDLAKYVTPGMLDARLDILTSQNAELGNRIRQRLAEAQRADAEWSESYELRQVPQFSQPTQTFVWNSEEAWEHTQSSSSYEAAWRVRVTTGAAETIQLVTKNMHFDISRSDAYALGRALQAASKMLKEPELAAQKGDLL